MWRGSPVVLRHRPGKKNITSHYGMWPHLTPREVGPSSQPHRLLQFYLCVKGGEGFGRIVYSLAIQQEGFKYILINIYSPQSNISLIQMLSRNLGGEQSD